ncbi:MAG: hypothetical protein WC242_05595 [Candidatus Paceibacterota bacterium]|jgi:hypothetical protein
MIFEHSSKNKKFLLVITLVILVIGIFAFMYSPVIFQEGNPWSEIKGIIQLKFSDADIVQLSGSDNKFMTESKNGMMIHNFMKTKGYEFTEQMGSGYFFKSPTGQSAVATHKYYGRYYSLWTITENSNGSDNNLWVTITNDNGITYQYPKELLAKYISVAGWPPTIKVESGNFSCVETPQEKSSMLEITSQRLVDNRIYCVNVKNEGATGSVYSSYVYTTPLRGKLVLVSFVLRYPNCVNYDEEQSRACTSEREAFDLDATVDRIVQTIKWDSTLNENTLASQLFKCLVSSYSEDKEKCDELLKQITDFDSCVMAGFSILKSNPAQCQTIDGRIFVQETNSTWEQALLAVNNCEVRKAFQKHRLIVTLTLKNANKSIATEPQIDDIITVVRNVESKCGKIPIATE